MTCALIVPSTGTVVLRDDGSVAIVDRNRQQYVIAAELVAAICRLTKHNKEGEPNEQDSHRTARD